MLIEKDLETDIVIIIRKIYCSKTINRRNECIEKLKNFLKKEPLLLNYFNDNYLNDDILNKWTCLYKTSIYSEHSNNYLENFFRYLSEKGVSRQKRLLYFLREINDIVDELINNHENMVNLGDKKKKCNQQFKLGYDIYLTRDYKKIKNGEYYVCGSEKNSSYHVDILNWFCSCPIFNKNGYTCKPIFFIVIELSISKE